jgi:hypothetical protein
MEKRKNCWLISTDKPSRLYRNLLTDKLFILENSFMDVSECNREYQNIYITNSEEIKEGDWYLDTFNNQIIKANQFSDHKHYGNACKKIILTTDQDLIKDGVQAIDDEFLAWFVNNSSCEEVEVGYGWIRLTETNNEGYWVSIPDNQFEMQQAEPKCTCKEHDPYCCQVHGTCPTCVKKEEFKQECTCENPTDNTCGYCEKENKIEILEEAKKRALEEETLEKAAEIYEETDFITTTPTTENAQQMIQRAFIGGAKYMAKKMYTEEDMIKFAEFVASYPDKNRNYLNQMLHAKSKYDGSERTIDLFGIWFEQFKKK